MQHQETRLMIELLHVTTEIGLTVLDRVKSSADVATHSLEADLGEGDVPSFVIELEIDRPLDALVGSARAAIPADVRAIFTIWRFADDEGEEIARLYADPVAGWFNH